MGGETYFSMRKLKCVSLFESIFVCDFRADFVPSSRGSTCRFGGFLRGASVGSVRRIFARLVVSVRRIFVRCVVCCFCTEDDVGGIKNASDSALRFVRREV